MIPAFLTKRFLAWGLKKLFQMRQMKRLRDYVEKENELDVQLKVMYSIQSKHGKSMEEVLKDVAILKKDSHKQADFVCMDCGCNAKRIEKVTKKGEKK